MKFSITSIVLALFATAALSSARPSTAYGDVERRDSGVDIDELFARHLDEATELFARDLEAALLERRGGAISKLTGGKKDPERKAKYPTGNPRPETPQGEFRQFTAGKKDDYFGDWKTMTKGVNNPTAGRGRRG